MDRPTDSYDQTYVPPQQIRPDRRRWLWSQPQRRVLALFVVLVAGVLGLRLMQRPVELADPLPEYPIHFDALKDRLDPNTATAAELSVLPGLGPVRAQAIIDYRESQPGRAFGSVQDLQRVHGIGEATAAKLAPFLYFGGLED